jgi:RNA polymerase sigma-70 factor (ECF subfamily)
MPDLADAHAPPCRCAQAAPDQGGPFMAWVGDLVHRHRLALVAVARREGLSAEDAFDAAQDAFQTFLTLPTARALVDADDDSRRMLVTLVRNEARNRRRLHAVARPHVGDSGLLAELPADSPGVEDLVAAAEQELRLRGCVQELADVQRAVVTLRMLDDVAGEDVARQLGLTPGHVAVLLHRAKGQLITCMRR